MRKGFAPIVILLVVLAIVVVGAAWYWKSSQNNSTINKSFSSNSLKKENLTLADRKKWRPILKWSDECEQPFQNINYGADYSGLTFYELTSHKYLIEVVCYLGAYQGVSNYFFLDESKSPPRAELLTFKKYYYDDSSKLMATTTEDLPGGQFVSSTKKLIILNKYRGPGDCGTYSVYSFPLFYPELAEFRAQPICDEYVSPDATIIPPSKWPLITLPYGEGQSSTNWKTYKSDVYGFTFTYPSNWVVGTNPFYALGGSERFVVINSPKNYKLLQNIREHPETPGEGEGFIDDIIIAKYDTLNNFITPFKLTGTKFEDIVAKNAPKISDAHATILNGSPASVAYEITWSWTYGDSYAILVQHSGHVYLILFGNTPSKADLDDAEKAILQSLTFI